MDWKTAWKKIWYFIWESDSIWSWLVNIVLAFIIIKFIVYPGIGLMMGTGYPIVAVVSGSMEHKTVNPCSMYSITGDCLERSPGHYEICGIVFEEKQKVDLNFFWQSCGGWYENYTDITKESFSTFKFKNGFNTGDIMILRGTSPEKINVGDTIVYMTNAKPYPIIHRVVDIQKGDEYKFITKGDHNPIEDQPVNERYVIGKAVVRVPLLGWIKIGFVKLINFFR